MITIKTDFELGQKVWLIHDPEQHMRQIIAVSKSLNGGVMYRLQCATEDSYHYGAEISDKKDVI